MELAIRTAKDDMITNATALILGLLFAFFSSELNDRYWASYLPIVLALAVLVPQYRFVLIIISAYLWAGFYFHSAVNLKLTDSFDNQVVMLSGVIVDIPEIKPLSVRFLVKPDFIEGYNQRLPNRIRLSWYRGKQLPKAGQRWQFRAKLRRPNGFLNPAGFDYERWLLVKGIGATGYIKKSNDNQLLAPTSWWNINQLRSKVAQSIDYKCVACDNRGLIKALTIGYRGDIQLSQKRILKDSGTAHLLAISGLHIGLISGLFYLLGRWLWRVYFFRWRYNRLEFSAALSFVAGLSYAALAGFSIPTVRALIMLGVIFFALKYRLSNNLLNTIATTVVLILIIDPLAVGSTSLCLSVGALMIIGFAQYLLSNQPSNRQLNNRTSWLRKLLLVQGVFTLMFIPIGIVLFGQVNIAGYLANVVAIPAVSFVLLPLTLLASFCASVNLPYTDWLLIVCDRGLSFLLEYLEWLLNSGFDAIGTAYIPLPLVILSLVGLAVLAMPRPIPGKKLSLILVLLPAIWRPEKLEYGSYEMTILDVGMGTSVVIRTRHHSMVYDFGPGNDRGFSAGSWVVKPFLQHYNIITPDLMVISHVDQDHSGGFHTFKSDFDSAALVSGTPRQLQKRFNLDQRIQPCHSMSPWRWDGVDFQFLAFPKKDNIVALMDDTNNRSCVLKIQSKHAVLLAGDIEAEREDWLVSIDPDRLKADLLVAPHHGSSTSSTSRFIDQVSPNYVIFTVGKDNRWNFPKPEVVARYQTIMSQIYRTDQDGAVTFFSDSNQYRIESQRTRHPRFWH
ncbi:MAG: competence protein ComEC [Chitinophagales bacterium]|jgi:competence protein ComEC